MTLRNALARRATDHALTQGISVSDENRHVELDPESRRIHTHRLILRPWHIDDAVAACAIYGAPEVARWLCPALPETVDRSDMRRILRTWMVDYGKLPKPGTVASR